MTIFRALVGVVSVVLCAATAQAGDYPDRPIRILCGFPAGSSIDTALRAMAPTASKQLGVPVVIENRPGAGGLITVMATKHAPADGYTLMVVSIAQFRNSLVQKVEYDNFKDFSYVAMLSELMFGIISRPDAPWKDMKEMIAYARSHPGEVLYGVPAGLLAFSHMVMAEIGEKEGIRWEPIPFKGSSDAIQSLLSGDYYVMADATISFKEHVRSGRLNLFAMTTPNRSPLFPDKPTLKELGYDINVESPWGLAGPANIPPAAAQKIASAFKTALADPAVVRLLNESGQYPRYEGPAEYTASSKALVERERARLIRLGFLKK